MRRSVASSNTLASMSSEIKMEEGSPASFHFSTCAILDAPSTEGQTLWNGVQMGPTALWDSGLQSVIAASGMKVDRCGQAFRAGNNYDSNGKGASNTQHETNIVEKEGISVHHSMIVGSNCRELHEVVYQKANENKLVLTLGGDHSVAAGSISGIMRKYPNIAIIWVDAHGDLNTAETSPSGNYHGMVNGHLLGLFKSCPAGFEWMQNLASLNPARIVYIGLRDLDDGEQRFVNELGITCFAMDKIDSLGIGKVMEMAIAAVDPLGVRPLHLSFDIDACDPSIAPGTGTRVRGGLSYREAHYICESVARTKRLVSMDMVEVNPLLDLPDVPHYTERQPINSDATKTVRLALELIGSVLGKRIL